MFLALFFLNVLLVPNDDAIIVYYDAYLISAMEFVKLKTENSSSIQYLWHLALSLDFMCTTSRLLWAARLKTGTFSHGRLA